MVAASDDQLKDLRTVFVRGVSFDVTDEKPVEELFSNVGPVKACFLVKTRDGSGGKPHKGVGYVQFALPEDAQRAIRELNGSKLAGRKISVRSLRALNGQPKSSRYHWLIVQRLASPLPCT
jgi:nucleolar protein 4